jgi:hypothetical protein
LKTVLRGVTYFALVFGAGFILGPIRVLWLVPQVGERLAEMIEVPIMLAVIVFSARLIVRRFPATLCTQYFYSGAIALGLLLVAETTLILSLRGLTISEYVNRRDPVTGTLYLVMLLVFAGMPWIVGRRRT